MKKLLILLVAGGSAGVLPVGAIDLKESKFTQVVNDVQIISTVDNSKRPAAVEGTFKIPDVLRTGPASRAELVAEDRTITRVGANTIFSFDQANRSIRLEKGSLLFNSPKGKGGGSIHTAAATAAVIGTTIIVTTTPDGGFKLLTLEGKTDVRFQNGMRQRLDAGQMTFVLPGGLPGPVIMFRLDQQVGGSTLVKGFTKPLPAQPKIEAAVSKQGKEIASGRAEDTGLLVGDQATAAGVEVITLFDQVSASLGANEGIIPGLTDVPPDEPESPLPPGFNVPARLVFKEGELGFQQKDSPGSLLFISGPAVGTNPPVRVEYAAGPADAALDPQTISAPFVANDPRVFTERVDIFAGDPAVIQYPAFTGFIGDLITVNTPSLDLNQFAPLDRFTFLSLHDLHIAGDLNIAASNIPEVSLRAGAGNKVVIDSGKTLNVDSPALTIISPAGMTLAGVTIRKQGNVGLLDVTSDGAISMNDSFVSGGNVRVSSGSMLTATGASATAGGVTGTSGVTLNSAGGMTVGVNLTADAAAGAINLFNSSGIMNINSGVNLKAATINASSSGGLNLNGVVATGNQMGLSGGGAFGGSPVNVQNSTFNLTGSLSIQNNTSPLTVSGSQINAGSVFANSSGAAVLNNDTVVATGQANVSSSGALSLSDTMLTADSVRLTAGGAVNALRTASTNGEIKGNSSVVLNSGSGATIGVDITSGTTPTSGSISVANSSGQLTVSPGVKLTAGTISMSSPDGMTLDNNTLSGNRLTLTAGRTFGEGSQISVRNSTVSMNQSVNVDSRAGMLFDTTGVTGGSVSLTGGSAGIIDLDETPGGPIKLTKSTFDLTGSMNVNNNSGVLTVDNVSRITAAGSVTVNSRGGMAFDNATVAGNQINLATVGGTGTQAGSATLQNSTFTSSSGISVQSGAVSLNNATLTANSAITVQGSSVGLNNTVLDGERVTVNSSGFISAPNVAPNNGRITGISQVNLTSQSGGMTIGVNVSANAASGAINVANNGGVLNVGGGRMFQAAFVNVSSPGGLLFDNTTVSSATRVNFTAGSQPGTLAVVQNTSFTGAADVNIAGHTVVLNQVNFASGSAVSLSSALGQLAPNPNTGQQVQGGFVNYIQNVNYGGAPAQDFTGAGKPITIRPL
jgi:hypothetical protein